MSHGPELTVVIFLCVALTLGAATRICARHLKLPYTVIVLLIGCLIGVVLGQTDVAGTSELLGRLDAGTEISADIIIFIFLPALVFESAFAFDVHAFRRELAGVAVLAVPALLVSTAAVGGMMYVLAGWAWEWSLLASLVFGALISATDPVAVVAILRETPSPKRLGVLIEGESLLNDGTAIVIFSALLAMLLMPAGELALGSRVLRFLWVVGGGIGVGLTLGVVVAAIIGRVFNDALVEITLTVVTAYAAMVIAEAALHVSGVMAIVTSGLWLAGPGRTRISPEVHHFLHQFWEMVSYLANTLIFFLVGLVIAAQWQHATPSDFLLILVAYVAVIAIRFAIMFAFRPIVGLVADSVSGREATLLAWGGLRGAVSLALALIVSQRPELPPALRHQILLVTTGVVLLTILVNGSTVAWLLDRLGLTKAPLGERIAGLTSQSALLEELGHQISDSRYARDLCLVPWDEVVDDIRARAKKIDTELQMARSELEAEPIDAAGYWEQALCVERGVYWRLYARGLLDGSAAQRLDRKVAVHLDRVEHGDLEPPRGRLLEASAWRRRLTRQFRWVARLEYTRLALTYELARAQSIAAEAVLANLDRLGDDDLLVEILATYRRWEQRGKERVEELRAGVPELAHAIEVRLAQRIRLNLERAKYEELLDEGAIVPGVARDALEQIKTQMKCLHAAPKPMTIPETATIVARLPLFEGLSTRELTELAEITEERVFEPGTVIMEEGAKGDSMYVIARGAVHVTRTRSGREEVLGVLGGGEIVGEMSLLTDLERTATVRAATAVTAGRVSRADFERVMEADPGLRDRIWQRFAAHQFDNLCRVDRRFSHLDNAARDAWFEAASAIEVFRVGDTVASSEGELIYLVSGELDVDESVRSAPIIFEAKPFHTLRVTAPARVMRLAPTPT